MSKGIVTWTNSCSNVDFTLDRRAEPQTESFRFIAQPTPSAKIHTHTKQTHAYNKIQHVVTHNCTLLSHKLLFHNMKQLWFFFHQTVGTTQVQTHQLTVWTPSAWMIQLGLQQIFIFVFVMISFVSLRLLNIKNQFKILVTTSQSPKWCWNHYFCFWPTFKTLCSNQHIFGIIFW